MGEFITRDEVETGSRQRVTGNRTRPLLGQYMGSDAGCGVVLLWTRLGTDG